MPRTHFKSVDAYLAAQPPAARGVLGQVREALRAALPGAEEVISYQIPAYRLDEGFALYFAAWKAHYAIYPVNRQLVSGLSPPRARYELNDKGTLRLGYADPVPVRFLQQLARRRARQLSEGMRAKRSAPKRKVRARTARPRP